MNAERLLAHYERIADAPDAIPRLRRFILNLAVRGKLVPQDPNDEPASELLKRIKHDETPYNQRGKRANNPILREPSVDDVPFSVPVGWTWVRLGQLGETNIGLTYSPGEISEVGIPVLRSNNIQNGKLDLSEVVRVSCKVKESVIAKEGDLLICARNGSRALVGKVAEIMKLKETTAFGAFMAIFRSVFNPYIYWFVSSPIFRQVIDEVNTNTINQLTQNNLRSTPIPLPPLAEQHRIVVRLNELMTLCDRLEAARVEREKTRDRLTTASLARLNTPNPETFRDDARFALDTLPALTACPHQITQLRQTILNLAVRGKLVPQDENDPRASVLLDKKYDLPSGFQRRRKILREATVDPSTTLLPEIPETWAYAEIQQLYQLGIIIDYADGNHGSLYPRSSEFGDFGITFVSAKDLVGGLVNWESCSKLNEGWAKRLTKGWAQSGDVLLTHNATVGRVARVAEPVEPFLLGTSVTFYRLNQNALSSEFFYYVLLSPTWQGQLEAIMAQTTRNQVSIQKQAFFRIPIPPRQEQHRIVTKLDDLMAICDRLETSLTASGETRRLLLDALLAEALEADQSSFEEAA